MSDLQFDKVEPSLASAAAPALASRADGPACQGCGAALGDYFDVNGLAFCAGCKDALVAERAARSPARFLKAALFGSGAVIASSVLYYAVAKITGYEIGLVAIVVGLAVGWAVHQGSGKRGGRTYQFLAMALTYTAICLSHAPALFEAARKAKPKAEQAQGSTAQGAGAAAPAAAPAEAPESATQKAAADPVVPPAGDQKSANASAADSAGDAAGKEARSAKAARPKLSLGELLLGLGAILGFLLALPFLTAMESPIGVLLIAIAIYEAWKLNREVPLSIAGPLQAKAAPQPEPAPVAASEVEGAGA